MLGFVARIWLCASQTSFVTTGHWVADSWSGRLHRAHITLCHPPREMSSCRGFKLLGRWSCSPLASALNPGVCDVPLLPLRASHVPCSFQLLSGRGEGWFLKVAPKRPLLCLCRFPASPGAWAPSDWFFPPSSDGNECPGLRQSRPAFGDGCHLLQEQAFLPRVTSLNC